MHKKILKDIAELEIKSKKAVGKIQNIEIVKSDNFNYLEKDIIELKNLYRKEIIPIFKQFLKLIKKNKYRKYFIKYNYDKLIISRYLLIKYYKFILECEEIFGIHNKIIKKILKENYINHFGFYTLKIYKPDYINLVNMPSFFIYSYKFLISKEIRHLGNEEISIIDTKRWTSDGSHAKLYLKNLIIPKIYKLVKTIGLIIAKIRFTRRSSGLITKQNLDKYIKIAKPGDILLTRGNWNASNISIPGFWKHMAIYVGNGKFLKEKINKSIDLEYNSHYIIEATSKGVKIEKIEDCLEKADYLGAFRLNFSEKRKLIAIKKCFNQIGKNYDFMFDFHSNSGVVCSELVLKSYMKKDKDDEGIEINLLSIGLNYTFPPNYFIEFAKKAEYEVEPLFFIDSIEKNGENFVNSNKELLESGKRSRFTIFVD